MSSDASQCYFQSLNMLFRMMKQFQVLKRLPVPTLSQSISKYLASIKPFLIANKAEYEQTSKIASAFINSGEAEELQQMLRTRAAKTDNWLSEWWLQNAYLKVRTPVVINSNPGLVMPKSKFFSSPKVEDQCQLAARLTAGFLDYKQLLDEEKIPQDFVGVDPACMSQYYELFGNCRIPGPKIDSLYKTVKHSTAKHIVVFRNNMLYKVNVYNDNKPLTVAELSSAFLNIVKQTGNEFGEPVGLLTMEERSSWAAAYSNLCKDEATKASLEAIHDSIFTVSLDKAGDGTTLSHYASQMLHGAGSGFNSGNRWFDKTLQLIVGENGIAGLNYEHSPGTNSEGPPIAALLDHAYIYSEKCGPESTFSGNPEVEKLTLNLSSNVLEVIKQAKGHADAFVGDVDLVAEKFVDYGKALPKHYKMSPDSFLQVAFQLAYYRMYNRCCATYESGSLRKFLHGRTDTIRSCHMESLLFCQSMMDPKEDAKSRVAKLKLAVMKQRQVTDDTINGEAWDRHFLGLKLAALESGRNVPPIFMDTSYAKAMHFQLSTSQVACRTPMLLCFGAVVPDGYGICYNPQSSDSVLIMVSSYKSSPSTGSAALMDNIFTALKDMKSLLESTNDVQALKAKL